MPVYEYTALDRAGKNKNGIIDADSLKAARQKLRGSGIFPVEVKETQAVPAGKEAATFALPVFFNRVKPDEVHVLTRQLATLLNAGIPLVAALDALIHQTTNASLKRVLSQIKDSVNEGNSLTHSLAEHPKIFSSIYINMVRAGEASGSLDLVLDRLAEFGERQQAVKSRFKAALVYPLFMACVGILILFFLLTFIVPNITRIFTEINQALPLPTLILIALSDFLKSYWWAVLLALAVCIIGLREAIKREKVRRMWDSLVFRLPVVGLVNRKIALARFTRTLGSLLQNGVPMLTALQIVQNIVNNVMMSQVIEEATEDVRAGRSLYNSLMQHEWFPPMVLQMISVGEHSGQLEAMLSKVADAYERDVEAHILGMTSLIEPVMILIMGIVVLFIVLSILMPIFDLNQMVL